MKDEDTYTPYETPHTDHLDEGPEPYQPRVFAFRGRIGRARFVAYTWWCTFVVALFSGFLLAVFGGFAAGLGSGPGNLSTMHEVVMLPWMFAVGALTYLPVLVMAKRRLNDLGLSGWLAVLVFAPFLNLLFILYLLLWPGQPVANRYGPPPASNGVLVWIFGVAIPVLLLLLFVVALLMPLLIGEAFWMSSELTTIP